jgi:molecular chaperone DnaJ
VPIQDREELKWSTRPRLDFEDDEEEDDEEEEEEEREALPTAPVVDAVVCPAVVPVLVPVAPEAAVAAALVPFVTVVTAVGGGGADGRPGAGSVGTGGSGIGEEGTVTATVVVTGGTGGTRSAAAAPVSAAAPTRTSNPPSALIPEELPGAENGCARGLIGNNHAMAVLKRDYYEVLGVSKDADEGTIRRAFYDLAREWHPDIADAPDAEARFRELAEAYSVLSKREARVLYDRYGYRGRGNQGFDEALWETRPAEIVRGDNLRTELELRSFEAQEGTQQVISFHALDRCTACMGHGVVSLPDPECEYCLGTGRKRTLAHGDVANVLQVEACPACVGEPCPRCNGEGTVDAERRIRLRIPPGVDDGALLRVGGDGNDAGAGSVPGDLLVRVHVLPPPRDPRSVRFLAFALLLVAVAALALYVIR